MIPAPPTLVVAHVADSLHSRCRRRSFVVRAKKVPRETIPCHDLLAFPTETLHRRTVGSSLVWSKMKDPFLLYILLSALVGFLLPTSGAATDVLDWQRRSRIFLLFLGYGARLSTAEAWAGLKHWRCT